MEFVSAPGSTAGCEKGAGTISVRLGSLAELARGALSRCCHAIFHRPHSLVGVRHEHACQQFISFFSSNDEQHGTHSILKSFENVCLSAGLVVHFRWFPCNLLRSEFVISNEQPRLSSVGLMSDAASQRDDGTWFAITPANQTICRARRTGVGDDVACLEPPPQNCGYAFRTGDEYLCQHPHHLEFADQTAVRQRA